MVGGAYAPQHRWRRSIQVDRLPSHSQGYCGTHERPGTWRRCFFPGWILGGSGGSRAPPASEFRDQGQEGGHQIKNTKKHKTGLQAPPGASRGLQGPPPGASSRGLQGPPGVAGASRTASDLASSRFRVVQKPPGPPCASRDLPRPKKPQPSTSSKFEGLPFPGVGGVQEPLTSFKLSKLSTYANEEVLLLTKMDLTEFRS